MRVYNFSAGPSMMPEAVLKRAAGELLEYGASGQSVMEMSHRSKDYEPIIFNAMDHLRKVMNVPDNYKILFLQGGATMQFSQIPMNLISKTGKADYAVTGNFSNNAYKAALKFGTINIAATSKDTNFSYIPQQDQLTLDKDASYFHYCMNNTIYGSLWNYIPETGNVPLIADMSSCILSESVDISKFGMVYAGAQKNMGPSGLTVVIIREDLTGSPLPNTPDILDYATLIKNDSMLNTPPCYGIYVLNLILDWIDEMGGLTGMKEYNKNKCLPLYDLIDNSSFYKNGIELPYRSMMNVTFQSPNEELDAKFVKEASAAGFVNLKGHRLVGGMRASIYNAMPMEGIEKFIDFMKKFEKANS